MLDHLETWIPAVGIIITGVWQMVRMGSFITRMDTLLTAVHKQVRKQGKRIRKLEKDKKVSL